MKGRSSSNLMETHKAIEAKEEPHLSNDSLDVPKNNERYNNTQKQQQQQQPQQKKQVRRRLHTSKPYQERLLNMAEARREIVAALKFHRASMKQQEATSNNHILQSPPQYSTSYCPMSTFVPPPPMLSYDDNQNFILPTQSLGLNLNYQSFSNLDTNIYQKPLSIDSPSSSSTPHNSLGDLHHAMDDEEMEEIRSIGEKHQIEWNDTMNIATSARWSSFLNTMKIEAEEVDGFNQFDQVMEFPPWMINANESSCMQQLFDDHFSGAYFQDPALPCMDIDETEAMDGEWLA